MATTEERLARLEERTNDIKDDVAEIKQDLKALLATLDGKYYTRREGRVVSSLLTIAVSVIAIWDFIARR